MLTEAAIDRVVSHIAHDPAMQATERGLIAYRAYLFEALDTEEDVETESGVIFCGCDDCDVREILTYVVPRVVRMAVEGVMAELADRTLVDRCSECGSAFESHDCGGSRT